MKTNTNKLKYFNNWLYWEYKVENLFITENTINLAFNKFNREILSPLKSNDCILMQFRIKLVNNTYKSMSTVNPFILCKTDEIQEFLQDSWNIRSGSYSVQPINTMIFAYKVISHDSIKDKDNRLYEIKFKGESINNFTFKGFDLPSTMDITLWGDCIFSKDFKKAYIKHNVNNNSSSYVFDVTLHDNYYDVNYINSKGMTLLSFTDTMLNKNDLSSFTRKINNQKYIFENNIMVYKEIIRKCQFIKQSEGSSFIEEKIITMDIETKFDKLNDSTTNLIPYCISIYDGSLFSSFYLSDFKNSDELLISALKYLMRRKYNGYKVYIHNLSKFDGVFLLRIIASLFEDVQPIIRDGNVINIKGYYGPKTKKGKYPYKIYFRDSLLLLPSSLAKLAKNFGVEDKGIFPYNFVTNSIPLDYKGVVPSFNYFSKINMDDYNNYCKSFNNSSWDLRKETIKYCELDCLVLYNVLIKFNKQIFNLYSLNVFNSPTLSSLALKIFKFKYLGDSKIPIITGSFYTDLKNGYTGGSVDVFEPYHNNNINKGYYYDVNSLYPYVMLQNPMPVGEPKFFEGNVFDLYNKNNTLFKDKPFGIFHAKIEAPENLNIPILQTKINNKLAQTLTPLGKWEGWYFSEELYNALDFGYKFTIDRGYLFEKDYIFNDYVTNLYELKLNSVKDSPNYIISKLLLNSLYGKLGMNPRMSKNLILKGDSKEYYQKFLSNIVHEVTDFHNGTEMITFTPKIEEDEFITSNRSNKFDVSIGVAIAVTAYARIFMSKIKKINDIKIYYSDTDSIICNKPLPNELVGGDLGLFKLEYIFDEGVFLCPKVYGLKWKENGEDKEIVKVKGVKNPLSFNELSDLRKKNHKLEINQKKWFRNNALGNISIKDEIYTLIVTDNKRKLIFNDDMFSSTSPLYINTFN